MKVLIIGNMGYVGSVLARHLRRKYPKYELHGLDNGYFEHCLLEPGNPPEAVLDRQIMADARQLRSADLSGYDSVVQLAAVSNDPMGKQFEEATISINVDATLSVARAAAKLGVGSFVLASSCSVYGVADDRPRSEDDPVAPITAYARSKIAAEEGLRRVVGDMNITALRFATACGASDRLRLDLVLNDFVAAALAEGRIMVLSDGTPWRPLIDVSDMARAIDWAIHRPALADHRYLMVNTGASANNYRVKEIADAVAAAVPGTIVQINTAAPLDSRSYQVDFSLFERLAPDHVPKLSLKDSIEGLVSALAERRSDLQRFRSTDLIRLNILRSHLENNRLSSTLEWAA